MNALQPTTRYRFRSINSKALLAEIKSALKKLSALFCFQNFLHPDPDVVGEETVQQPLLYWKINPEEDLWKHQQRIKNLRPIQVYRAIAPKTNRVVFDLRITILDRIALTSHGRHVVGEEQQWTKNL